MLMSRIRWPIVSPHRLAVACSRLKRNSTGVKRKAVRNRPARALRSSGVAGRGHADRSVVEREMRTPRDARRPTRFRPPAFFAFGSGRDEEFCDVRQPERSAWRRLRPAARPRRADRGRRARGDARGARRAARGRRRAAGGARLRRQGRPSRRSARTCCARSRRASRSSRSSTTRWSRCSARTRPSSTSTSRRPRSS